MYHPYILYYAAHAYVVWLFATTTPDLIMAVFACSSALYLMSAFIDTLAHGTPYINPHLTIGAVAFIVHYHAVNISTSYICANYPGACVFLTGLATTYAIYHGVGDPYVRAAMGPR